MGRMDHAAMHAPGLMGLGFDVADDARLKRQLGVLFKRLMMDEMQIGVWNTFAKGMLDWSQAINHLPAQVQDQPGNSVEQAIQHLRHTQHRLAMEKHAINSYIHLYEQMNPRQQALADIFSGF
ncbi:MAG: hypothetical protein HQL52_01420 [Magnetococcales bacterium]|nr:hypothetical protein [Magnetococcales bacterium]